MARFARIERFGGPEVIEIVHEDPAHPGPGEVRVRVRANGLNPVDYKIFRSAQHAANYGAVPPCGIGMDFAGDVDEIGEGVTRFAVGDAVLGGKRNAAVGDFVIIGEDEIIIRKPDALDYDRAGALAVVGRTGWAIVAALSIGRGDTVFVSAAAGGVGVVAAQLAVRAGAIVVGTAGEDNHEFLRGLGVIPVAYGEGMLGRLRDAAPQGYTAALDNNGPDSIDAALELGIPLHRINTIAARGHRGAQGAGSVDASLEDFAEIARLVAEDEVLLPIDSIYPIERVREAYERLEAGHLRGKIVLVTE